MQYPIDPLPRISAILAKCGTLQSLTKEEVATLAECCLYRIYPRGKEVLTIDHEDKHLFIVGGGRLSLKLRDATVKKFEMGELFGEIAAIGNRGRLGTVTCEENAEVVVVNSDHLLYEGNLPLALRFKILVALTKKITTYFYKNDWHSTKDLLEKGECQYAEYKVSLSQPIIVPTVKSIMAFMNRKGGTVLVGVRDDGTVAGIQDDKGKIDKFQRDIYGKIKSCLGQHFAPLVSFDLERINDQLILRIDVMASTSPVFFKEKKNGEEKEWFIVRTGCLNTRIKKTSKIVEYILKHFEV